MFCARCGSGGRGSIVLRLEVLSMSACFALGGPVMQALLVEAIGQSPRLSDVRRPSRGSGGALLRVLAAPLNPADISIAAGRLFAGHPPLPYVPGIELVGEVLES